MTEPDRNLFDEFMAHVESDDSYAPNADMVKGLAADYPFFTLPAVMALQSGNVDAEHRKSLSAMVALNAPDGESLMNLVDPDRDKFRSFYPVEESEPTPTTDKAIDTFLDTYGKIDEREQALLEKLIFNPVPDYSQVLAKESVRESEEELSSQDAMLEAFLAKQDELHKHHEASNVVPAPKAHAVKPSADSPLSESLAKIFIKQHRYDKAYEIIYQLSLNFPKKSIYFADQLRFLRKLMLNQEYENR